MPLGNMRELGILRLAAFGRNDACRHQSTIDVSAYSDKTTVPWFQLLVRCSKCGGRNVDVRPNWKEQPPARA